MEKLQYHKKEIEIPLYRGIFVLILTNDKKELRKVLPGYQIDNIYGQSYFVNWNNKQGFVMVLNPYDKRYKITIGTIAHEACHIASYIAKERCFKPDFDNDEPIAYLTGWICDEAYKFFLKKYKKGLSKEM